MWALKSALAAQHPSAPPPCPGKDPVQPTRHDSDGVRGPGRALNRHKLMTLAGAACQPATQYQQLRRKQAGCAHLLVGSTSRAQPQLQLTDV